MSSTITILKRTVGLFALSFALLAVIGCDTGAEVPTAGEGTKQEASEPETTTDPEKDGELGKKEEMFQEDTGGAESEGSSDF